MAKKRKAKIKRKRAAKKSKAKKPPTGNVDAPMSDASDEALESAATASKFTRLCG